jgi:hypothetical protein
MARQYEIVTTGTEVSASHLKGADAKLRLELRRATVEAAQLIDKELKARHKGAFARFSGFNKRRFAGPLAVSTFQIDVGVEEPSIASYVEYGTGIYAQPERGGPHVPWVVVPKPGRKPTSISKFGGHTALKFTLGSGSGSDAGLEMFASKVTIKGMEARPWIEESVDAAMPAIDKLYERRVHAAVGSVV